MINHLLIDWVRTRKARLVELQGAQSEENEGEVVGHQSALKWNVI